MTAILCLALMVSQPVMMPEVDESASSGFRIGPCFVISWPSMQDEKDFEQMNVDAGLDFQLAGAGMGGSVEVLADLGDRFRIRGGLSVLSVQGAYEEDLNPWGTLLLGLCTAGISLLFDNEDNVIDLDDRAVSLEVQGYYMLSRNSSFSLSVGAGPVMSWVKRDLSSPNTSTSGSGSGFGVIASLRLDQESPFKFIFIPVEMGLEAGYRYSSIELDDAEAGGFTLDFSGPFLKLGTYFPI